MLNAIMLNANMLNAIILTAIVLFAIMLNVTAPCSCIFLAFSSTFLLAHNLFKLGLFHKTLLSAKYTFEQ